MSDILGFGTNSYRLYESGEIPSVANGRLILAIRQPEDFIKQVEASSNILSPKETQTLITHANRLTEVFKERVWDSMFLKHLFLHELPNQFSGYRKPNLKKLANVIAYFCEHMESVYKTKLNKLLFYTDFGYYKRTAYSMTGLTYRAIPLGPVPAKFEDLFNKLCEEELISITQELINGTDNYGDLVKSIVQFDESLFNPDEQKVLEDVTLKFKDCYAKQMVNLSHKEKAWEENKESKSLISYQKYAFELVNL
jgi:uncharacterized phage-associated protein